MQRLKWQPSTEDDQATFRTVTIGDSSVGKTSIVNQFIRHRFNSAEKNTIGALYDCYTEVHEGRQIEVQIWDTAGQEQYRSLSPVYFRSASAALLVFDVTNRTSFESLDDWLQLFKKSNSENTLVFVVGNKIDLVEERKVTIEEARDWARKHSSSYFETSAQNADGITTLFKSLAVTLAGQESLQTSDILSAPSKIPTPLTPEKKRCC
jgi:small GTP-binding protein